MTRPFNATSTTDEVLSGINPRGKRILVTGVSAGLGVETARSLAAHGAHVIGAARDIGKAEAATAQVRKDAAAAGGNLQLVAVDLASLASVRSCAQALLAKGEPFQYKTLAQGAATSVWAAVVAAPAEIGGRYLSNCQVAQVVSDRERVTPDSENVCDYALDPATAAALWKKSEQWVGETF